MAFPCSKDVIPDAIAALRDEIDFTRWAIALQINEESDGVDATRSEAERASMECNRKSYCEKY